MVALDVGRDEAKRNIAPSGMRGQVRRIFERLLGIDKKAERDPFEKLYAQPSYYLPIIETEGRAGWTNRSRRISEIWRSPSGNRPRPYGMAMDFWLMAEKMVLEMMTATARMQDKATSAPPLPSSGDLPSAAPVGQVRELAECMW